MTSSVWGYFVVMFGILSLLAVNYVGNFANNNELDYYAIREIQQSAMMDAIDVEVYRTEGKFKISEKTFIELFTRRFAEAAGVNRKYEIIFDAIMEEPPMTSITIKSTPSTNIIEEQTSTVSQEDLIIQNRVAGILLLDDPVINIKNIKPVAPSISIKTLYRSCPFVNGVMQVDTPGAVDVFVSAQKNDMIISDLAITETTTLGGEETTETSAAPGLTFNKHFDASPDYAIKYKVSATVNTGSGVSKTYARTVQLEKGAKCQQVISRPSVSLTPLNECGDESVEFNISASSNTMTDLYFTINSGATIKIANRSSATVSLSGIPDTPGEISVSSGDLFTPFTTENRFKGNIVKAWATPAGAEEYPSPEKIGVYTILNSSDSVKTNAEVFEYTPGSTKDLDSSEIRSIDDNDLEPLSANTWTRKDVVVKLNPEFNIGKYNETNTAWGWWTNRRPLNKDWQGYEHYSNNLSKGNEVIKILSAEGRRKFKVTVDLPASKVGLGCNNARLSSSTTRQYLIDKTPPPRPNVEVVDTNGDEIFPNSNDWYNKKLQLKIINALDYGEKVDPKESTGSGTVKFQVEQLDENNNKLSPRVIETYETDGKKSGPNNSHFILGPNPNNQNSTWNNNDWLYFRIRAIDGSGWYSTQNKDGSDNPAGWRYIKFKVDTTPPRCTNLRYVPSGYDGSWTSSNITVRATCEDTLSLCTKGNPSDWDYNSNTELTPGSYTIYDYAGNSDYCGSRTVRIDKSEPVATVTCEAAAACDPNNELQNVLGKIRGARDPQSGITSMAAWFGSGWEAVTTTESVDKYYGIVQGTGGFVYFRVQITNGAGKTFDGSAACPTWTFVPGDPLASPSTDDSCHW